ncbi:MAG: M20/M25/M40 family metallo-hydrolase, partial [Armatimonadota bacterium]
AYQAARTCVSAPIVQAMIQTYRAFGYEPEVWPTIASSMPLYLFTEVLGLGTISGGLGHGGRAHAANEYATVEGMRLFEKSLVTLLFALADELDSCDSRRTG